MKKIALILSVLISLTAILASCGANVETAYQNEAFGIGFAPADGLVMADAAEIAEYAGEGVICEMMATDPNTGSAVVVSVESAEFGNAEDYLAAVKAALDLDGFQITFGDVETAKIAGENFAALIYSVSAEGISASMATYARVEGDEMLVINASYGDEAQLNEFLNCFVSIN